MTKAPLAYSQEAQVCFYAGCRMFKIFLIKVNRNRIGESSVLCPLKKNIYIFFPSHVNQEAHKLDNAEEVLEELTMCGNYIYGSYHTKADNSVFAVQF